MTENYSEVQLQKDDHQFRFEIDGLTAFIDYGMKVNNLVLIHTEVPEQLQGRGVAAALVTRTFEYAEGAGLKIVPKCAYIAAYLRKHPEWNRIVYSNRQD